VAKGEVLRVSRYDPLDLFAGVGATAAHAAAAPATAPAPPATAATVAPAAPAPADPAALHTTGAGAGAEGAMIASAHATGAGAEGAGAEGARAESGAGAEAGAAAEGPARARHALLALISDPQNNMCVRRADRPGVAFGHGAPTQPPPPPTMEGYDDDIAGSGGGDDDVEVCIDNISKVYIDAGGDMDGRQSLARALEDGFCPAVAGLDEAGAEEAAVGCFVDVVAGLVTASPCHSVPGTAGT